MEGSELSQECRSEPDAQKQIFILSEYKLIGSHDGSSI
jgi:hypothetical protein